METRSKNILLWILSGILILVIFGFIIVIIIDSMKTSCYEDLTVFKNYYEIEGFNNAVEQSYNMLQNCDPLPIKFNNDTIYAINYDCLLKE